MTPQEALDILREYLTTLYANPRMLGDETEKVIQALEEHAIPLLECMTKVNSIPEEYLIPRSELEAMLNIERN